MYLSFFVIIYNFTKGRNISRPRCAPLPRTVSKLWKKKRKLLSCRSRPRQNVRHFHVIGVQRRQRNIQKKACVQSCCLKSLNVLLFCHQGALATTTARATWTSKKQQVNAKQQLYTCITLFCTFLHRPCTTTT